MTPRELDQVDQLVFVHAPHHDAVELQGQPGGSGCGDAGKDVGVPVRTRQLSHPVRPQRVEADRDPAETCSLERLRLFGEQQTIRGQSQIANRGVPGEHAGERRKIVPQ